MGLALFGGNAHGRPPTELLSRIDQAMTAGATYLVSRQQEDGTWRSSTYGLLKDGASLTPLVLVSLPDSDTTRLARQHGWKAVSGWLDRDTVPPGIRVAPQYPVYTAALILQRRSDRSAEESQLAPWRKLLADYQLAEVTGWSDRDERFGGWGYSHAAPRKPQEGDPLSPLDEPNLSATLFALNGLSQGPPDAEFELIRARALRFVRRCQNWDDQARLSDAPFNDGGFHFLLGDDIRNKPGIAGTDSQDRVRYRSYGSATADGWRSLRLCGLKADHPRVVAARKWLIDHLGEGGHSGSYPTGKAHLQPALDYYYAASLAQGLVQEGPGQSDRIRLAGILAARLVDRQRDNGAWINSAVDVREDDPLIATSFALQALRCAHEILSENKR